MMSKKKIIGVFLHLTAILVKNWEFELDWEGGKTRQDPVKSCYLHFPRASLLMDKIALLIDSERDPFGYGRPLKYRWSELLMQWIMGT